MPPESGRSIRRLIRSRARTFYLASLFLPPARRREVHLIYAYYRSVDDLVDEPPAGWPRDDILATLAAWEDALVGRATPPDPLLQAVVALCDARDLDPGYLAMVIQGARRDLDARPMATRHELYEYSIQVAGSVGMAMAQLLGARDPAAAAAACDLGVAMQYTNILRDVGEDLARGRIYLPQSDLLAAGCTPDALQTRVVTPAFRGVMRSLMTDARDRYQAGMAGIPYLDPSARRAIRVAALLYARILDKIEQHDYDVFSRRAHLGTVERWTLALQLART